MDYNESILYIHGTYKFGIKLGLENIRALLNLMGNPQSNLKFIHIAGTNGKGSTAAFITQILIEAGYTVGTFTSPYLRKFTERITVNNTEIEEDVLAKITTVIKDKIGLMKAKGMNHPTEFEIITAIGFQYFFEKKCDIVILEVGMGGRFDSTNIINSPLACVMASISYDHTKYLGKTLTEIASEKAGIIKDNSRVVAYPSKEEAIKSIEDKCSQTNSVLYKVRHEDVKVQSEDIFEQEFNYENLKSLKIHLPGDFQTYNAAVAVKTVQLLKEQGYKIEESDIRNGLKKTEWPGRIEVVSTNPTVIIDGAHNPDAVEKLSYSLKKYFPGKKIIFIMGVMKDKDFIQMIEKVTPIASCFIAVTASDNDRALAARELAEYIKRYCNNVIVSDTIKEAVKMSINLASVNDVICALGSLYYIGEVKSMFDSEERNTRKIWG